MIKSRRKVNKALIVNNVRLSRCGETGSTVYTDLTTGESFGFADHRRLKMPLRTIKTVEMVRAGFFGNGIYLNLIHVSG